MFLVDSKNDDSKLETQKLKENQSLCYKNIFCFH